MAGLIDFSRDAASNDVSLPPILWVEGQPANTVNNSARAMMAALAAWRDDNTGVLAASRGVDDAYRLSTVQGFSPTSTAISHTVSFRVASANQGPTTLSIDGQAAKPVLRGKLRQLAPGDLSTGIVYSLAYIPSEDAYLILSPAIDRPGKIEAQAHTTFDPGWLPCDGRAVSRTAYVALFDVIGTTWGAGNGSTTFNLPKLNGRAMYGADDLGGTAANVLTGDGGLAGALGSTGGTQTVTLIAAQMPIHTHAGTAAAAGAHNHGGATGADGAHDHGASTGSAGAHSHAGTTDNGGSHSHTGSTGGAGSHTHNVRHRKQLLAGGNDVFGVTDIGVAGTNADTDGGGTHTHDLTIAAGGLHQHGFTTDSASTHVHAITAAPTHTHAITAAPNHTHDVTLDDAGSGAAHPNMPPGVVVAFAIKA